jgi:hypothetical protein
MPKTLDTKQQTLRRQRYEQLCEEVDGEEPAAGMMIERYALIVGDYDNNSWISMAKSEQAALQDLAEALNQEGFSANASPGEIYDLDRDIEDVKGISFTVKVTVTTEKRSASFDRSFPE